MNKKTKNNSVENRIKENKKISGGEAFLIVSSSKYRDEHKIQLIGDIKDAVGVENGKNENLIKTIIQIKKYYMILHTDGTEDGFNNQIAIEVKQKKGSWVIVENKIKKATENK